jgi:class 3 adenylate cyclase/Tfp pilus assembly protein PilF
MAVACQLRSDHTQALEYYQKSLKLFDGLGEKKLSALILGNIGNVHTEQEDYSQALDYHQRSLSINEEIEDSRGIASSLVNIGNILSNQQKPLEALNYYQRALKLKEDVGDRKGTSNVIANIGNIYADIGEYAKALEYYEQSLEIKKEIGDKWGMTYALSGVGNIHIKLGNYQEAVEHCQRSSEISKEIGALLVEKEACECLYNAYKAKEDAAMALKHHEYLTVLKDSIFNEENTKELTRLEMQFAFDKKEALMEETSKRQQLGLVAAAMGLVLLLALAFAIYIGKRRSDKLLNKVSEQHEQVQFEKRRGDKLLLNILPESVAQELMQKEEVKARQHEQVTVLFTDFEGFTELASRTDAENLVDEINTCFSAFDHLTDKFGVEKIKTIGDAYMAAGGLGSDQIEGARQVVQFGLRIQRFMKKHNEKRIKMGLEALNMRVGIHTGPVAAGIVGVKKFQYDIWGDTVNTAARMENSGEVGKVNISETTYELVKDQFACTSRGEVEVKGKGLMKMYFAEKG